MMTQIAPMLAVSDGNAAIDFYKAGFDSAVRKTPKAALLAIIACMFGSGARCQQATPADVDSATPELVLQTGQNAPAQSLAFSNDGRLLASGGYGGLAINVWETATGRQLRLLSKHGIIAGAFFSGVTAIALSRDGQLLAAGFVDSSVTIWDLNSGEELVSMQGPGATLANFMGLRAIQFSPDGKYLLTKHADGIKIWDLAAGTKIREIKGGAFGSACDSATFTSDSRQVVSVGGGTPGSMVIVRRGEAGGKIQVVSTDVETGKEAPLGDVSGVLPSLSQGKCLVASADGRILMATATEEVESVWEVGSRNEPRVLNHAIPEKIAFYPSLQTLSPSGTIAVFAQHAKLYAWDLNRSALLYAVSIEVNPIFALANEIASLEFTPTGDRLAVGTYDGRIRIFNASSGQLVRKLEGPVNVPRSVTFDSHGHKLFSGQKTAWNLDSGQGEQIMQQASGGSGMFNSDGSFLAVPSQNDGDVQIWNVAQDELIATLSPKSEALADQIAFSPDGKFVAVTYVKSPAQIQKLFTAKPALSAPVTSPGTLRAPPKTGKGKNKSGATSLEDLMQAARARQQSAMTNMGQSSDITAQIKIWEIASGNETASLPSTAWPGISSSNLSFSPDGRLLAVATAQGIEIWDFAARTKISVLQPVSASPGDGARLFAAIANAGRQIQSVRYSPDGRFIATALRDSSKSASEIQTAMDERFLAKSKPRKRAFNFPIIGQVHPAGSGQQKSAPSSSAPARGMSYEVRGPVEVWDVSNGQRVLNLAGHPGAAGLVAFSPNGKLLATTGIEDDVKLWDLSTGKEVRTLSGHTARIEGMAFAPNSDLLATASGDGTTRIWDITIGEPVASLLSLNDGRDWLVVTSDGLFDGSPSAWNQILWRFGDNIFDVVPVEIFFNEYYYPDLLADILAGKRPHPKQNFAKKDRRQPQLTLESPSSLANAISSQNIPVKLSVDAAPAGAQDVRLFRNGSLVKVWRGDVLAGKEKVTLEANVRIVAGPNRLSAYAFNGDNIKSVDVFLDLTGAESLRRKPVAYILAVGINEYANSDYNLHFADADAQGFSDELTQQLRKQGRFERFDVTVLSDRNATKSNILKSIGDLADRVHPEDELFIFIASHGTAARDQFYLIPYDLGFAGNRTQLDEQTVGAILQHSISDRDLEKVFEHLDAGRLLLVIDACNSGQALEAEEKRRGPMNSKGLAQLAYEKGMYILTASQSYQAAQEISRIGHGLLTYALVVEGLGKGMADFAPQDGKIVMREWLDYASSRVPQIQLEELQQARTLGRSISFGDASRTRTVRSVADGSDPTQHPKVFYRRELETTTWVVSTPR
jgi:WD40 repeat protein